MSDTVLPRATPAQARATGPNPRHRWAVMTVALPVALVAALAGCSQQASTTTSQPGASPSGAGGAASVAPSSTVVGAVPVENNPPGDIPDNVAYVSYTNTAGKFGFKHPEGWVSSGSGLRISFTDKSNGITAEAVSGSSAPTVDSANAQDIPALQKSQTAFELRSVKAVALPAGQGVLIVYRRNSAPDPVTGKILRDEVERFEIFGSSHRVDLELFGAVGSDNVDPYAKISQSLRLL